MNIRTHQRIHRIPSTILFACFVTFFAVLTVSALSDFLREQNRFLPLVALGVSALGPVLFLVWWSTCFAAVRQGFLTVKWFWRAQHINLRKLEEAEIIGTGRRSGSLVMRLVDADGTQLFLPLLTWRDEDLLMARVLRATVDCRVKIEGDPMLVRRFARVLESYKSWDRQLAA